MTTQDAQQLWTSALRSGEYKQGKNCLHNATNDTYCCLGVACDLYNKHSDNKLSTKQLCAAKFVGSPSLQTLGADEMTSYNGDTLTLPTPVARWLGVTSKGHFQDGDTLCTLAILNDIQNKNFNEIADVVDAGRLQPFKDYYSDSYSDT